MSTAFVVEPLEFARTTPQSKSVATGIVVLSHLAALGLVALYPEPAHESLSKPIEVIAVSIPQPEENDVLLPPPTIDIAIPLTVEPVTFVIEETKAITLDTNIQVAASHPEPGADTAAPKLVTTVEYVREPNTVYPPVARALKQRGTVTLRALIDAQGHACEVSVLRSSGYRVLDDAARQAVATALFKPYTENGQAIPVYVVIPIEFGAA